MMWDGAGLDPPLLLYFPRLIGRTFWRIAGFGETFTEGCRETLGMVFTMGDDSILWWAWSQRAPTRQYHLQKMQEHGGKWHRIGGWGSQLRRFARDVENSIKAI